MRNEECVKSGVFPHNSQFKFKEIGVYYIVTGAAGFSFGVIQALRLTETSRER